eukprot:477525-Rhodomonas_salina.2
MSGTELGYRFGYQGGCRIGIRARAIQGGAGGAETGAGFRGDGENFQGGAGKVLRVREAPPRVRRAQAAAARGRGYKPLALLAPGPGPLNLKPGPT